MSKRFIGTSALARRYGKSNRTIARWVKDPPRLFPRPIEINGRHLWDEAELEAYERAAVANASITTNAEGAQHAAP